MSAITVLMRWRRCDFRYDPEADKHWDIVSDILSSMRRRTATTLLVWVKGHSGDPGNTMADKAADEGCGEDDEDVIFHRNTTPMQFYKLGSGAELSRSGWTAGVERHARGFQGRLQATRLLSAPRVAKSTKGLLRTGAGRSILGPILSERGKHRLPALARRDFIQMIGNAFPVGQVVERNTKGACTGICPLCKKVTETYSHMQMGCSVTKDARQKAHNLIVAALLKQLRVKCRGIQVHAEARVDEMGPCPDTRLAAYKPDAIIEYNKDGQRHIVVLEFTRSLADDPETQKEKVSEKKQAYQSTVAHLQRLRGPGTIVTQQTFVMSCHATIMESEWDRQLGFWGLDEKSQTEVKRACMKACVLGNHEIANVRRHKIEEDKTGGGSSGGPTRS